jgi:hypothetical protein
MNAQGSSLIGGSAKLLTPVDLSSYLARATDKLLRLHTSSRAHNDANPAHSTTDHFDTAIPERTIPRRNPLNLSTAESPRLVKSWT